MNWKSLTNEDLLQSALQTSYEQPVLIFKHSTRCPVSYRALDRLQSDWNTSEMQNVNLFFLDLIKHRSISNKIASVLSVRHESPQAILLKDGECVYHDSHMYIDYNEIKKACI